MTTSVKVKTALPAVVDEDEGINNILKASEGSAPLLKFRKGRFYISGDIEVPLGTKFLAYCRDWRRGWVKFVDGKKVDERMGRAFDGFVPAKREDLDDLDKAGMPDDPWSPQDCLPVENAKTGDRLHFVTGTKGGQKAVRELCNKYSRVNQGGQRKGLPTVALAEGKLKTQDYGNVPCPDFVIVGWENDNGDTVVVMPPSPKGNPSTDAIDVIDDEPDISNIPKWVTEGR